MEEKWGEWAFLLGVLLALVVGLFSSTLGDSVPLVFGILAVLGLIVGLLNISEKEVNSFLIATIALLAASASLGKLSELFTRLNFPILGEWITGFVGAVGIFVAPAAVIVALKGIYTLASKK